MENVLVLFVHWFADFYCQTDKMAINKSKSVFWLGTHCLVYTGILLFWGWKFAIINGVVHFCIDFVTSKINAKLWASERRHDFFVVIGFDQFLHTSILLLTYSKYAI